MQKYKKDMIVYVNTAWNTSEKCKILDYIEDEPNTGRNIYILNSFVNGSTFGATEDCIFTTEKDAIEDYGKTRISAIEQYKSEIKNLNDLLQFPLKHFLYGEDTDYEAVEAYKSRANELAGVVFNKEG